MQKARSRRRTAEKYLAEAATALQDETSRREYNEELTARESRSVSDTHLVTPPQPRGSVL